MSYFDEHNLERIQWCCSLNLERYCINPLRGLYDEKDEYVVTWYENRLSLNNSNTFVEVTFINLTTPTYCDKSSGEERQSFFAIALPINYLHKIPFGSIWRRGRSKYKFQLEEYNVTFSNKRGLRYQALWQSGKYNPFEANIPHPFEADKYVHSSYLEYFKKDGNRLLVINQENDNLSYIIHPLHFFMAHYGYSSELKRILITYNWQKIKEKLRLDENPLTNNERPVILPRNLSEKDAIFLYHLKYDNYTKEVVSDVATKILLAKENNKQYRISCWHDQSISMSFYGIRLGDSVLCCQITGISQPQGEPINLLVPPIINRNKNKVDTENDEIEYRTVVHKREHDLEKLDIALNPVNNIVVADVIEKLQLLGEARQINKIQDTHEALKNNNTINLHYGEPTNFSVGEKFGRMGNTGIANCFYDIPNDNDSEGKSRLDTIWEHAKRLRSEIGANVYWYTPKCDFNQSDNFKLVSLDNACEQLGKNYPSSTLILTIKVYRRTFFIISFPERESGSGFSSIVYEPKNIQEFLVSNRENQNSNTLIKLLIEIISLDGISSDYIDSKNGRMAAFKHREGQNNNWVKNGINKLLD